jgi:two-component system cell cycle sensor histidine kinase/response regulator CckA
MAGASPRVFYSLAWRSRGLRLTEQAFSRPGVTGFLPTTGDDGDTEVSEGRGTVLVVDDEEMVRRLAARMLLLLGYKVLEARDGQEALKLLQRPTQQITGVLTDLAMPGIGGRSLGETIANCWPQVRVLYMSGFPAQRMVNEGALDPSHPFIQKPFTSEQLGRKVRELLAHPLEQ